MTACPHPSKARFGSRAAAQTEAVRLRADLRRAHVEPYQCVCGLWHLASVDHLQARIARALTPRSSRRAC